MKQLVNFTSSLAGGSWFAVVLGTEPNVFTYTSTALALIALGLYTGLKGN